MHPALMEQKKKEEVEEEEGKGASRRSRITAPADGEVPLECEAHGEVGGPGHEDVLHRVPQVGEGQGVRQGVHLKHLTKGAAVGHLGGHGDGHGAGHGGNDLDHGVVYNAGDDVQGVDHGQSHQQLVEGGAHLRAPEMQLIITRKILFIVC